MSLIYFMSTDGRDIVALDCENEISMSRSNTVTSTPIFDGITMTDGFIEGNYRVTLAGKLSYFKTPTNKSKLNPIQIQDEINKYVSQHKRFTLYTSAEYFQLLNELEDCVIIDHSVSLSGSTNSVDISLTIENQYVSKAAKVGVVFPKRSETKTGGAYDTKKDNGRGSNKQIDPKKEPEKTNTLAVSIFGVSNVLGDGS